MSAALNVIAELQLGLIFKGGTCIKKAYYPEFRFSSDLDFSVGGNEDVVKEVRRAFENKMIHGINFSKVRTIEREKAGNAALALQYVSQASDGEKNAGEVKKPEHVDSIRTEFSAETPVLLEAQKREMLDPFEYMLPKTCVECMALEEILAEKIHAIYHRRKPRDLYDLAYLLDKGIQADRNLIAAKLKPLNIGLEIETFKERLKLLGERWNEDLNKLFIELPDFETARTKTLKNLF